MSTKTIYKRIALVAVATLGAGLLSVAPASATVSTARTVFVDAAVGDAGTTYTSATGTLNGNISVAVTKNVALTTTTATTEAETISITPVITSAPAGSAVTVGTAGAGKVGLSSPTAAGDYAATNTATDWTNTVANGVNTLVWSSGTIPAQAATVASVLSLTADVAGTYVVTLNVTSTTGTGTNTSSVVTFYIADLYATTADGLTSGTQSKLTANAVAGPNNTVTLTFRTTASASRVLSVSGASSTLTSVGAPTAGTSVVATDKLSAVITDDGTAEDELVVISTPVVGTITVSVFAPSQGGIYSTTPYGTVTITVNAAALNGTLSVANSTAVVDATSIANAAHNNSTTVDDAVLASSAASTTAEVASIKVTLQDTLKNTMPNTTIISAVITGSGSIAFGSSEPTAAAGRAVSGTTSSGIGFVTVYADGTEGVGTITISVGTTVVATKTVTFYGDAAKYVAVVKKQHIANSGSSTADVVEVTATDKAGNLVPSSVIYASVGTSTTASVVSSVTTASTGKALFAMTGLATKFGAVVVTFGEKQTAPTVTTTATVGVSSARAVTAVAASDKAIYAPGEKITWTLTFKDANGLGIPDDAAYAADTYLKSSASNPVASASLASTPFVGNVTLAVVAGVATATGFAPLASGPITFTWTLAGTAGAADTANLVKALQATTITATATVENPEANAATDAANEATDAANAATDAALAAADAADAATAAAQDAADAVAALSTRVSTLVSNLRKQITALTKLVQRLL